jgi:hypothetical protein
MGIWKLDRPAGLSTVAEPSFIDILVRSILRKYGKFYLFYSPILNKIINVESFSHRKNKHSPLKADTPALVYIDHSTIAGAGKGIFSLENFKAGDIICEFEGQVLTTLHCSFMKDSRHIGCLSFFHCIRPFDDEFGHLANHQFDTTKVNAILDKHPFRCKLYLKAINDIAIGDEIFVQYTKYHLCIQPWASNIE